MARKIQGIKKRFLFVAKSIFEAHEEAKFNLIEAVEKGQLNGAFGEALVDDAKKSEALVDAFNFHESWVDSSEFEDTSEEMLNRMINTLADNLKLEANRLTLNGLKIKDHWRLSGVMEAMNKLDNIGAIK